MCVIADVWDLLTLSLQCFSSICYLEQKENILGGLANCY